MALHDQFISIPLSKMSIHKFIIIVLKKLELGDILNSSYQMNNYLELSFSKMLNNNQTSIYKNDNRACKVLFEYNSKKDNLINVTFKLYDNIDLTNEFIGKYEPYINNKYNFKLDSLFQLKLQYEYDRLLINDENLKKIRSTMLSFQKYNEYYDLYTSLATLEHITTNNKKLDKKSILQFQKNFKHFEEINDVTYYVDHNIIKNVIDVIVTHKKTLKDLMYDSLVVKFSNFSVSYGMRKNNSTMITLKVGSFILFNGTCIEMFKYLFHPGLYMFVKYLDLTNNVINLDLSIQKHLFKKV